MDDPRNTILENLDFPSCRVEFCESPIVLLCGGKVKIKERANDPDPPIASFRHAITKSNASYEFFRPEEITDWQSDGIYKNLMDFEEDLSGVCSLVVIILESAGAIAELGAFSQLPDLSKRLIVIRSNEHAGPSSFINLGILRYISEAHESSVKTYPWVIGQAESITSEVVEDVISDIKDELSSLKKTEVIRIEQNSHVMVVICELIRLFVALKETEICTYLHILGADLSRSELKRKLFLLKKFKLICLAEYSDAKFYLSGSHVFHRLRLSFNEGYQIDALRIPVECSEYYNSKNDRHRIRVVSNATEGGE